MTQHINDKKQIKQNKINEYYNTYIYHGAYNKNI